MAKTKKISLTEFNQWLEGIEEFKDRGWTPTADEWKRIRSKIKTIEEVAPAPQQPPAYPQMQHHQPQRTPGGFAPPPSGIPLPPEIPSTIPESALNAQPTQAAQVGMPKVSDGKGGVRLKTPDSSSTDESPFS